jgi:hypothetical protein
MENRNHSPSINLDHSSTVSTQIILMKNLNHSSSVNLDHTHTINLDHSSIFIDKGLGPYPKVRNLFQYTNKP